MQDPIPSHSLEKVSLEAERLATLLAEGAPVSVDFDPYNGTKHMLLFVPVPAVIGPHLGLGASMDTFLVYSVIDGSCIMLDLVYDKVPPQKEIAQHLNLDETGSGAVHYLLKEIAHYRQ